MNSSQIITGLSEALLAAVHCYVATGQFCNADYDCNGDVGTTDLLLLFADWGPCVGCAADLDCDGNVDTNDLIQLLGSWNTCNPNPPLTIPQSIEDCINRYFPDHTQALIACIEAMGQ